MDLHESDELILAGQPVPDSLAPAQLDGPWDVGALLTSGLSVQDCARVRRFVDDMPVRATPRTRPFPPGGSSSGGRAAAPGLILRRLLANRNIRVSNGTMVRMGGGPKKADTTYRKVFGGALPLDDIYVNTVARITGIPVPELAGRLGIGVEEIPWEYGRPDLIELGWAARRLDDAQLQAAMDLGRQW